jgi:uncharacterized protein
MQFVFDHEKSKSNKKKHGIDFYEAQYLFNDPNLVQLPSLYLDEERFIAISTIQGKYFSAIFTYRNGDIRLISVRRSREREIKIYDDNKGN